MSEENVERTLAMARAFNQRDWDAFVALTHDEIQVESRLVAMEGAYTGHEGLRRWWDNFLGAHIQGWGHGADSATPLIDPFWMPQRWRDGKCVWWRNCTTESEALEAAGLSE
jgi:hypothetical protein